MGIITNLPGRLINTSLPVSHALLPLFEAVVNSIQSIDESGEAGHIDINIIRTPQGRLNFGVSSDEKNTLAPGDICEFSIKDNGVGFTNKNMESFNTLDSQYKSSQGCRGIGRLLWLKAFDVVDVDSIYLQDGKKNHRTFRFLERGGVVGEQVSEVDSSLKLETKIRLIGFKKRYQEKAPKTAITIAKELLEHCLWYFVRSGGAPIINIFDGEERIPLDDIYHGYMATGSEVEQLTLKNEVFELTHLKLNNAKQHSISWCAGKRVISEENITGKIPGLHGKLSDSDGHEFYYACYISSSYLDQFARPERIGFDTNGDLFSAHELNLSEIKNAVLERASLHLSDCLAANVQSSRERLERFVSQKAPRYRPILNKIGENGGIDPNMPDKELELLLHKLLSELEGKLISEGHDVMNFGAEETPEQYRKRLASYLQKADDIKKSDLANYVFHRKVVIDILEKSIERKADGRFAREDIIHELIMPMIRTSNEVMSDSHNLWLIDERLAFHNYLGSDLPIKSMDVTDSQSAEEPDIVSLHVADGPILVSDQKNPPFASLVIIEFKRPMRNDFSAEEGKDPIEQSLRYLKKIRDGKVKTSTGRQIPNSENIPGFCFVICDMTPTMEARCQMSGLTRTSDYLGYFGYNANFRAYIEVMSFDRLLRIAKERNRAFFDKLGLPSN